MPPLQTKGFFFIDDYNLVFCTEIGLLAYLLSRMPLTVDGGMEQFCFWAGTILIFTVLEDGHGPLVWPLGIWIAGLGLGELAGIPVGRLFTGASGHSKTGFLILVLYFGTYFLFCWR